MSVLPLTEARSSSGEGRRAPAEDAKERTGANKEKKTNSDFFSRSSIFLSTTTATTTAIVSSIRRPHGAVLDERRPDLQCARDDRRRPSLDLPDAPAVPHLQDEEHDR